MFKNLLLTILLQTQQVQLIKPKQDTICVDTVKLNRSNVINYINKLDIKFKDIVYAQILLETNSFKSSLCKRKHNLFGMHCTTARRSTALSITKGYARYKNWQSSIDDYYFFQKRLFARRDFTRQQYLSYLRRNFATAYRYDHKVTRVISTLNQRQVLTMLRDTDISK